MTTGQCVYVLGVLGKYTHTLKKILCLNFTLTVVYIEKIEALFKETNPKAFIGKGQGLYVSIHVS